MSRELPAASGLGTANVLAEAGARVYVFSRTGALKDPSEYCHENIIHIKADVCDRGADGGEGQGDRRERRH